MTIKKPGKRSGNVNSATMAQVGTTPIAPGSSPQFTATPGPPGVRTLAWRATWWSSDTVNAPVTMDADSWDGRTGTVRIPLTATVGVEFQLTWAYTSPNRVVMEVEQHCVIVAG